MHGDFIQWLNVVAVWFLVFEQVGVARFEFPGMRCVMASEISLKKKQSRQPL
jgi:hypothetical protein